MFARLHAKALALCLGALLCSSVAHAQSVAFINPGKSDEVYWVTATQGMQAAAKSLGMTFEVQYAQREPLKTFAIAREMVARPPGQRPDYIVITDDYAVADQLLRIIDGAGVKTLLAYSTIPVEQRAGSGSPREKYKGWLGSLEPQAEDAGYLTARGLIERGKREKAFGADGKLHMLAIAGIVRLRRRSSAIRACGAPLPAIRSWCSTRRSMPPGRGRMPPSRRIFSTAATPTPG
jgi:ABC-type sugar transport system substrate-binding protein